MFIDFSSHFHIAKNHKFFVPPAWILPVCNRLHRFLLSRLWMPLKLMITEDLFVRKTV